MSGLQPLVIDQGLIQAAGNQRVEVQKINFGPLTTINVTSGTVTITKSLHFLNSPVNINVDNILGGMESDLLILGGNNVRLRTIGNLSLPNNFVLQPGRSIMLLFVGSNWFELSRTS